MYEGTMDPEAVELCDVINAMPGLRTTDSCCGHGKTVFKIFFMIEPDPTNEGLFVLARCVNRIEGKDDVAWEKGQ